MVLRKVSANLGMFGPCQKWAEVSVLCCSVVEAQVDFVLANLCCGNNIDNAGCHLSLFVIRSGLICLCNTKKSIHLATISFERAVTSS